MADNAGAARPQGPDGPAPRDAAAGKPAVASWLTFAVEAYAGRKIAGWPLGRFDIGAEGLRVRLLFPWFITRSAGKNTITSISVTRSVGEICCIRFDDSGQHLANVHVHMPFRAQRIIDELRQREYTVTDQKTGQPVARLPKRWQATRRPHRASSAGEPTRSPRR
jgi:hypothetical protein